MIIEMIERHHPISQHQENQGLSVTIGKRHKDLAPDEKHPFGAICSADLFAVGLGIHCRRIPKQRLQRGAQHIQSPVTASYA